MNDRSRRDSALQVIRDIADGLAQANDTRAEVSHALHEAANTLEKETDQVEVVKEDDTLEAWHEYVERTDGQG